MPTFAFVVSTREPKVSSFRCRGIRPSNSFHKSWVDVDGGRGRHKVFGRPRPPKPVISTLIWLEGMMCFASFGIMGAH